MSSSSLPSVKGKIQGLTPHGPGFSFVDSCDVDRQNKRALGTKLLEANAWYFKDHFPGRPLMPGVLLIEAAAQVCGILWQTLADADQMKPLVVAETQRFRFSRPVLPGETLRIEAALEKDFGSIAQFSARVLVGEEIAAQGGVTLARPKD
ncbi:MAG: beta-hydroxyacyl-ACP dehydratase [Verrucomicrobiae bacterium]|nr:beta-hydroxyacyl-ACP dehydratase [Verrucomicrobiae bacterium]